VNASSLDTFVEWLKTTGLSHAVVSYRWVWPACESLHFIGLALVIGIVGFFDLRLMGFFRRVPVSAARELMPFAVGGFAINLTTGLLFLIGQPDQYAHNTSWWMKVAFLTVAGLNALFFEKMLGPRTLSLGAGENTPAAAKVVGAVSLFAWFGVLYWGRMLPFIGNAF
jgi:hypothetical protein